MVNAARFDFVHNDYTLDDPHLLKASPKEVGKRGKTDAIIKQLFSCKVALEAQSSAFSAEHLQTLRVFSQKLSSHVEASIRRRYCCFAWLIIYLGKSWGKGALGTCYEISKFFDVAAIRQKNLYAQELQKRLSGAYDGVPKLLGSMFTLDPASSSGIANVDTRYRQLSALTCSLTPSDNIKMAWFIEMKLPKILRAHIKKNPNEDLPRSIHRDLATGHIFIPLKRDGQEAVAETDVKKVTQALYVPPLSSTAAVIAQLTTQDPLGERMRKLTLKEYQIAQDLKGSDDNWPPGIWPILHAVEHVKHKDGEEIPKVSLFEPLGEGKFSHLANTLSFNEMMPVVRTLLQGLELMHRKGYVHADIKNSNTQFKHTVEGLPPVVGWLDLGLASKATKKEVASVFEQGFYGTIKYTAPELFAIKGWNADYAKTDMWAFGLMLYRKYFRIDKPEWFQYVPEDCKVQLEPRQKKAYKTAIKQAVRVPLATLLQKEKTAPLSPQERFEVLIYKLMHNDPTVRLSATEALKELDAIGVCT